MRVWLALLLLPLSGCIDELLVAPDNTTRSFACRILESDDILLAIHRETDLDLGLATRAFADSWNHVNDARVRVEETETMRVPTEDLGLWAERNAPTSATLRIVVADDLEGTLQVLHSGVIAISTPAVMELAQLRNQTPEEIAAILVMHAAGHALGVVNMGIPMAQEQGHEAGPGHEAAPSVMASAWHEVQKAATTATPEIAYSAAVMEDWRQATVCI